MCDDAHERLSEIGTFRLPDTRDTGPQATPAPHGSPDTDFVLTHPA